MKVRFLPMVVLASLLVAACAPTVTSRNGATSPSETTRLSFGQSIDIAAAGARLSAVRAQAGIARPMGHSPALQAAAQAHADDMARTGQFSHTGSNGSSLNSRIRASGYNGCFMAENIAAGQSGMSAVFNDWMASSGHRRNMLSAQATQFGFARNGSYWVLVLGRSC